MKTPQEYREKVSQSKTITLPSGLECSIRGMPPLTLLQFTAEAQIDSEALEDYMRKNMVEVLQTVLPSSVVSPTLLPPLGVGEIRRDDVLYLDELTIPDLVALLQGIVDVSGIDKEKLQSFENFPANRRGKGNSPDSKGVQL